MRLTLRPLLTLCLYLAGLGCGQPASADLLVSANSNRVFRYEEGTGALLPNPAGQGGELGGPVGMTLSPDGITHLYVASIGTNVVQRFNVTDGSFVDTFVSAGSGGLDAPWGVAFGPDGNLYVASSDTNQVMRYDGTTGAPMPSAGNVGAVYASTLNPVPPIGDPPTDYWMGIAFGPDGNLYVVNGLTGQILIYEGPGGGTPGAPIDIGKGPAVFVDTGTVSAPQFLTFHNGDLYVGDFDIVQNTVMRYQGPNGSAPGDPVDIGKGAGVFVSSGDGGLERATGVTFGPDGHLYVGSTDNDRVLRYNGVTGDPLPAAGNPGALFANGGGLFAPQQIIFSNPEPGTMILFAAGAAGLGAFTRRRRRNEEPGDDVS